MFSLGTVGVTVSDAAEAGTFNLNVTNLVFGDTSFQAVPSTAGQNYQVTVIPAPDAALLILLGLGMVRWTQRRAI